MKNIIIKVLDPVLAEKACRQLTAKLPEWFGIVDANERYAKGCLERTSLCAMLDNNIVGLIVLEFPFPNNANIYWMAVDKSYHHQGVGKQLLQAAQNYCFTHKINTITVETLSLKHNDPLYLKSYHFYEKNGFKPLFELQPYGPEHTMCYLGKKVDNILKTSSEIKIRLMAHEDVSEIVTAFKNIGWDKPATLFQSYLTDQKHKTRFVWCAYIKDTFAGYVTLNLHSLYLPFREQHIPEINDLNVLPQYRNKGIGTDLLEIAELQAASISNQVGIGVGLYADYGHAQRLYIKRGYIPDGKGITYQYQSVVPGQNYFVDDDLNLWFTKEF
ncbi:MAG: GNAT family N-acetyltransferase [Proteobacteria bacterium]|nr:GNAT family N-acetyltransferase [Pseudomonadota bacterium]